MQRKTCYSILGLDAMPLFLKNLLLSGAYVKWEFYLSFKTHAIKIILIIQKDKNITSSLL
jgi:hypothetical protein